MKEMLVNGCKPLVVIGSINTDLVTYTDRLPLAGETLAGRSFAIHPGGKGANQAVAVARLGYPVYMIGRVGDDVFGTQLRTGLAEAGVNTRGVMISPGSSGVAVILVSEQSDNCIVIHPGANALLRAADLDAHIELIRSAGMVLTQLETPLETVAYAAAICKREGVPLMLDPAPAQHLSGELLSMVTWLTPNETEAVFYTKGDRASSEPHDVSAALLAHGITGVILKMGAKGAYLRTNTGVETFVKAFSVKPVDTTAAGDAFNGAFAASLLMGQSVEASARFASSAAAISVTRQGAQPSMPSMLEVMTLLKEQSK